LRKTSRFMPLFEELNHESVRVYYHRIKKVIKQPEKKKRKLIDINEIKVGKHADPHLECSRFGFERMLTHLGY